MARGGSGDGDGEGGREGMGAKLLGIAALITALGGVAGIVLTHGNGSSGDALGGPPVVASSGSAPASAPVAATSAAAPQPSGTASASTGSSGAGSNGAQIGSYPLHLSGGYGVPLAAASPALGDYEQGEPGDIWLGSEAQAFGPSRQNKLIPLTPGTAPTFSACTARAAFADQASSAPGTTFCIKAPGRMIGIQVTASHNASQPFWAEAQVTVWQYVG